MGVCEFGEPFMHGMNPVGGGAQKEMVSSLKLESSAELWIWDGW